MRTHNTQAQDPESYAQSIQLRISLASKSCAPYKCGTLVWIAGAVLLHKALFCFCLKFIILNNREASCIPFLSPIRGNTRF